MGYVQTSGIVLYYLGLGIMVVSMVLLIGAIGEQLSNVMGHVHTASTDPASAAPCADGPCVQGSPVGFDNPFDMAMYPADRFLGDWADAFMGQMGLASMQTDQSVPGTLYANIKRFFIHMAVGMMVMLIGMLLRMLGSFLTYLDGRGGQKQRNVAMRQRLGVMTGQKEETIRLDE